MPRRGRGRARRRGGFGDAEAHGVVNLARQHVRSVLRVRPPAALLNGGGGALDALALDLALTADELRAEP